MWQVKLIRPLYGTWKGDYFPRKFRYKRDALALKKDVERKGGQCVIEKLKPGSPTIQ